MGDNLSRSSGNRNRNDLDRLCSLIETRVIEGEPVRRELESILQVWVVRRALGSDHLAG